MKLNHKMKAKYKKINEGMRKLTGKPRKKSMIFPAPLRKGQTLYNFVYYVGLKKFPEEKFDNILDEIDKRSTFTHNALDILHSMSDTEFDKLYEDFLNG